jgi:hypothetical protein
VSLCTARQKFHEANRWAAEYVQGWLEKKAKKSHFSANEQFELACAHSGLAITCSLVGKFQEADVCDEWMEAGFFFFVCISRFWFLFRFLVRFFFYFSLYFSVSVLVLGIGFGFGFGIGFCFGIAFGFCFGIEFAIAFAFLLFCFVLFFSFFFWFWNRVFFFRFQFIVFIFSSFLLLSRLLLLLRNVLIHILTRKENYNIALTSFYALSKIHDLAFATIKNYFANFFHRGMPCKVNPVWILFSMQSYRLLSFYASRFQFCLHVFVFVFVSFLLFICFVFIFVSCYFLLGVVLFCYSLMR